MAIKPGAIKIRKKNIFEYRLPLGTVVSVMAHTRDRGFDSRWELQNILKVKS
jgi:hypothetical protein